MDPPLPRNTRPKSAWPQVFLAETRRAPVDTMDLMDTMDRVDNMDTVDVLSVRRPLCPSGPLCQCWCTLNPLHRLGQFLPLRHQDP